MEKASNVQENHRPRVMSRKERERGAHQREPKGRKQRKAPSEGKERLPEDKPEAHQPKTEQEKEVKLKSTVVDIDSVREKEETLALLEAAEQEDGLKHKNLGVFEWLLMVFALALVLLFFPFSIWFCVKRWSSVVQVVREHERAVIFRLGHRLQGKPKGPGLIFYLPFLDVCHKVDIRLRMLKVPLHTVVTKDLARPELSLVCYYHIENVALCSAAVSSLTSVLQSVVQAAVRDVLAQHSFNHILLHRRRIGEKIKAAVDSVACRWGIRMERADIDELLLPVELQQTLATEAEAKRQQQMRAKAAEGDAAAWDGFRASLRLLQPAFVLPFAPELFNINSDLSSLPPPPPPPTVEEEEGDTTPEELNTDSPMM